MNIILELIHRKMERDGWTAYTPDSYAAYLFGLSDEEIAEAVDEWKNREASPCPS